jgi:hypothetical protein
MKRNEIENADAIVIGAGAGLSALRQAADDQSSCDGSFVEDVGWHRAAERYENFLRTRKNQHILYLELGVGYNTPVSSSIRSGR